MRIAPYYRPGNRGFYAYKAEILQWADALDDNPRTLWQAIGPRRGDLKADAEAALKEYRLAAQLKALPEDQRRSIQVQLSLPAKREVFLRKTELLREALTVRGAGRFTGMLGRAHSEATKAAISAAIKARHLQGAYKNANPKLGRPTKVQALANAKARAAALGLSFSVYMAQMAERDRLRRAARERVVALQSLTPAEVRALQRKLIVKQR